MILRRIFLALGGIAAALLILFGVVFYAAPGPTIAAVQLQQMRRALGEPALVETEVGPLRVWSGGRAGAPTVVLIHGFSDEAPRWASVASALKEDFRVVVPELAGHGQSGPFAPPLDYDAIYAALSHALETTTDDAPMLLAGNSLGGWLALHYARDNGARVRRVLAINSAGLEQPLTAEQLLPTTREGMRQKFRAVFGDYMPPMPGFVLDAFIRRDADPRLHSFLETLEADDLLDGSLGALQARVDLVWGTPDPWFPETSYLPRLLRELPGATVKLLEGCGHSPQLGCSGRIVEAIRRAASTPDLPGPVSGQEL